MTNARALTTIAIVLSGSLAAAAALSGIVENQIKSHVTSVFVRNRLNAVYLNYQQIDAHPETTVLFWGASETEGFVRPETLEQELEKAGLIYSVYNLGFRSLLTDTFLEVVRGFRDRKQSAGTPKFKISVINMFPSYRFTRQPTAADSARSGFRPARLSDMTTLRAAAASWKGILDAWRLNPVYAFELTAEKTLWTLGSPRSFQAWLHLLPHTYDLESGRRKLEETYFHSLWMYPMFLETPEWDLSQRGQYLFNRRSGPIDRLYSKMIDTKTRPAALEWGVKYFTDCCNLETLPLDELKVRQFVETVETLKQFSEKVVVVVGLESWPGAGTPVAQEARRTLLARLETVKQIRILDLGSVFSRSTEFDRENYIDYWHLSEAGWQKSWPALVKKVQEPHE